MSTKIDNIQSMLEKFATDLATKYSLPISFNPEDQLIVPIACMFEQPSRLLSLKVKKTVTEVHIES